MATAGASAGSDHDRQQAILSCTAYSAASVLMVLLNKMVMSNFEFPFNAIVLVSQSLLALALMAASKSLGILDYRPFSWELARTWLPVNIFFTLMLYTSFRRCVVHLAHSCARACSQGGVRAVCSWWPSPW